MPSSARKARTRCESRAGWPATRAGSLRTGRFGRRFGSRAASSASGRCSALTGQIVVDAESDGGVEHVRFVLGLDDDHGEFLRRFAKDDLLGETVRRIRGLRPVRTGTVAQSLLRAVAGQLILAKRARQIERSIVRACTPELDGLHAAPTCRELGAFSPAQLARHGLGARRASALIRLCRAVDLERLKQLPTEAAADATRARAGPRPLVGRRRLPRGARPLRTGAAARSRPDQARIGALGTPRRGRGGRRPARPLRRVGGARQRLPARRAPPGSRTLAACPTAA